MGAEDSSDLAVEAEAALPVPSLFIMGDPSMCNAQRNFQPVFDQWPQYNVRSIAGASHCHFELPYDRKCAWLCGGTSEAEETRWPERLMCWPSVHATKRTCDAVVADPVSRLRVTRASRRFGSEGPEPVRKVQLH